MQRNCMCLPFNKVTMVSVKSIPYILAISKLTRYLQDSLEVYPNNYIFEINKRHWLSLERIQTLLQC